MSDSGNSPGRPGVPPASGEPPRPGSGCMTAFMILIGIVLLLPGLCAVVFSVLSLSEPGSLGGIMPFIVLGLLVGSVGVMLIWAAIRGWRP